ncbi:MAG: PepSY-associated TM helix domain-containing protein [Isosphaeraceae bacterium]
MSAGDLTPAPAAARPASTRRPLRRRIALRFAALMRWLHIYLSMFGLAIVLFFSVTGITLNHPDWFFAGAETTSTAEGTLDSKWLGPSRGETEGDDGVAKLEVVEHLRRSHGISGALSEFRIDPGECTVSFKGPGYAADAFIDRGTGKYSLNQTYHGFVAVINDLHKGRDTGPVWSAVIDLSAILMTIISLTGLVLLFYLKLRRVPGVVVGVLGTVVVALIVWLFVP